MTGVDLHVTLDDPTGDGGLAAVLADLVRSNIDQHPRRAHLLRRMHGTVTLVAEDADESTAATLSFDGSGVTVRPGRDEGATLEVRSSYEGLIGLSRVPVRCGLPVLWRKPARELASALIHGQVRARGSRLLAVRLLGLFSVA